MDIVDFSKVSTWIEVSIFSALIIFLMFVIAMHFKKKFVFFFFLVSFIGLLLSYIFQLQFLTIVIAALLVVGAVIIVFANLSEVRSLITNPIAGKGIFNIHNKNKIEKIYDHDAVNRVITQAVTYLSKNKIGALMTFERRTSLAGVIKSGTLVNAPVTSELLSTIFYPGTRLHDGAVVIHGPNIVAASVYFTPTTKPLTGKYGSRHRAAIGISEISDAVTVVVSEETGRISFAYDGELQSVSIDNFSRVFDEYMNMESKEGKLE